MALTKRNYVDRQTIITAQNLNDIQDNIIQNTEDINQKYEKPADGIPESDLSNDVRIKLNDRGGSDVTAVTVSYRRFGAVLDGVADDTAAAIATHEYANEHNMTVAQHDGILYLKTATTDNCPIIKTSCDWHGMTIKVDENMVKNTIMQVLPTGGVGNRTLTASEIQQLTKGTITIPFLVDYKNCICHFTTDISIGKRLNKAENYVYHETVTVDRYGDLLDGELFRAMTDATIVRMEWQSIFETPITVSGARFELDTADDSVLPTVYVSRSNMTLSDMVFSIKSQASSDSIVYKGEMIKIANCHNVTVANFTGENFGTFYSGSGSKTQTTYLLYLTGLSRFTLRDCTLIRSWGAIQSQYCKQMIFKDSLLGRIDNHYSCRDYSVSNCTLSSSQSCINIGYGDGYFDIRNVRFVKFADPDTELITACIQLRSEFCALYSGVVTVENAVIENHTGGYVSLITGGYTTTFDYGDASRILPCVIPETRIDGVQFTSDNVNIVKYEVTATSYAATKNLPIIAYPVSVKNVNPVGDGTKHMRLTADYHGISTVTMPSRYAVRLEIPTKSEWVLAVSGSALAENSHINNYTGNVGGTLKLINCYLYSNVSTFEYVRDLVLVGCHVYIGSVGTVKLNANHSLRCSDTVFEPRVSGVSFTSIDAPTLYHYADNYCLTGAIDVELAKMLICADTISNGKLIAYADEIPNISGLYVKPSGGIPTADYADRSVTNAKIALGAVSTGQLAGGSVTAAKLNADVDAHIIEVVSATYPNAEGVGF